ncbi:MAG: STAS domain-containing protein [Planctomycetes bacterium]|nr:STAS domain-containing protein [Planctomycetota bacterium]
MNQPPERDLIRYDQSLESLSGRIRETVHGAEADRFHLRTHLLDDGTHLVVVGGFLDSYSFVVLEQELERLIARSATSDGSPAACQETRVIVDLTELEYISSSGVGVLMSGAARLKEQGGALTLANPTDTVRDVFDVLGML